MRAHPELVRGPGAPDTELMRLGDGWVAKGGAEGLLCAARGGLGIALKCEDGGQRPLAVALAALLDRARARVGRSCRRSGRELARRSRRRASCSPERTRTLTISALFTDRLFRTSIRALWWWSRGGRLGRLMHVGRSYPFERERRKPSPCCLSISPSPRSRSSNVWSSKGSRRASSRTTRSSRVSTTSSSRRSRSRTSTRI